VSISCIHKFSASERGVYAASLLHRQLSLNSNLLGKITLKRPDRRRAEAALWRAAKAEGRAPQTDNSWMHRCPHRQEKLLFTPRSASLSWRLPCSKIRLRRT